MMDLVCKKCGSRNVAQKPIKGFPGAFRNYCPDCGSEAGYVPLEQCPRPREKESKIKNFWRKLSFNLIP